MGPKNAISLVFLFFVFILSGCATRTYQVIRDRVDQDLQGNRGCLQGKCVQEEKAREKTRTVQVVEIEIPYLFGKNKSTSKIKPQETLIKDAASQKTPNVVDVGLVEPKPVPEVKFEKYTVLKDDTLQKISEKFYGSSGGWNKIYQANKAVLKSPDRLYPGQSIDIPIELGKPAKSTSENKEVKDNIK
ncbi:MAG: LysM peptidoglycan-binding domain-containing protein [Candidatus Omnitrophota bacterium]